jgi:hypothetical protein
MAPPAGSGGSPAGTGGTPATGGSSGDDTGGGTGGAEPDAAPVDPGNSTLPGLDPAGDGDRAVGPNYTADPLTQTPPAGIPRGRIVSFNMTGTASTIYKGVRGNYTRGVSVYIPMQYVPGTPAPFMVTADAMGRPGLPNVLDNLIAAKKLPKIVVFFIANGGGDAVGSERGLEYDTVSGLYAEFVNTEVLPRGIMEVKTQANIDLKLTDDPDGRGTMGGSSGGACAVSMVWWRPDLFRRALTYSATLVTQVPAGSPFPHGAWIYHDVDPYDATKPSGLVLQHCEPVGGFKGNAGGKVGPCDTPLSQTACAAVNGCQWNTKVNQPIRVWLESGDRDLGAGGGPTTYRNFDLANQRMAMAMKARGYHYHYDKASNAGHVDGRVVSQTLAEAMQWVWRGYPIN